MRKEPKMSVARETDPVEPADPAEWPAWTDNWFWEVADDERAALEAAEVERITDVLDAPPLSQVSDVEWSMMSGGLAVG
jgi:hypothetical protein